MSNYKFCNFPNQQWEINPPDPSFIILDYGRKQGQKTFSMQQFWNGPEQIFWFRFLLFFN